MKCKLFGTLILFYGGKILSDPCKLTLHAQEQEYRWAGMPQGLSLDADAGVIDDKENAAWYPSLDMYSRHFDGTKSLYLKIEE